MRKEFQHLKNYSQNLFPILEKVNLGVKYPSEPINLIESVQNSPQNQVYNPSWNLFTSRKMLPLTHLNPSISPPCHLSPPTYRGYGEILNDRYNRKTSARKTTTQEMQMWLMQLDGDNQHYDIWWVN